MRVCVSAATWHFFLWGSFINRLLRFRVTGALGTRFYDYEKIFSHSFGIVLLVENVRKCHNHCLSTAPPQIKTISIRRKYPSASRTHRGGWCRPTWSLTVYRHTTTPTTRRKSRIAFFGTNECDLFCIAPDFVVLHNNSSAFCPLPKHFDEPKNRCFAWRFTPN